MDAHGRQSTIWNGGNLLVGFEFWLLPSFKLMGLLGRVRYSSEVFYVLRLLVLILHYLIWFHVYVLQ